MSTSVGPYSGRLNTFWIPDATGLQLWRRGISADGETSMSLTYPEFDHIRVDASDNIWAVSGSDLVKLENGHTSTRVNLGGPGWDLPRAKVRTCINYDGSIWVAKGYRVVQVKDGVVQGSWVFPADKGVITDIACACSPSYPGVLVACTSQYTQKINIFNLVAGNTMTNPVCSQSCSIYGNYYGSLDSTYQCGAKLLIMDSCIIWIYVTSNGYLQAARYDSPTTITVSAEWASGGVVSNFNIDPRPNASYPIVSAVSSSGYVAFLVYYSFTSGSPMINTSATNPQTDYIIWIS